MKRSHLLILGIILSFLAIGVALKQFAKPKELSTEVFASLGFAFDMSSVSKIEIFKGAGSDKGILLVKEGANWQAKSLANAHADQEKIENFLKKILEAKGELRGTSKSLFSGFGIGPEEAFHVKLSNSTGSELLHFLIGAKKKAQEEVFVRRSESEQIFFTDTNFPLATGIHRDSSDAILESGYWASTQMIDFDTNQVVSLRVARRFDGQEIVTAQALLETDSKDPSKKGWKFVRNDLPFPIDGEKVVQFLELLKTSKAEEAIDPAHAKLDFSSPLITIDIGFKNSPAINLRVISLGGDASSYPAQVSGSPVLFHLFPFLFENLQIDDSHFFKEKALAITKEHLEKLVIHSDGATTTVDPGAKDWKGLAAYLKDIESFQVKALVFDSKQKKKVKSPAKYALEIYETNELPQILDVGDPLEDKNGYAAVMHGNSVPFVIQNWVFQKLFENLKRLEEGPEAKETAAPSRPEKSN